MEWNLIDALDAWLWIAFRGIDHAGSNIGKINYGLNRPTSAHQHIIFYKLKTKKSVKICENISRIHEYLLLYIFKVIYLFVDIFKWIYIMQASPRSPALGVQKMAAHKRGDCSLALLCWELWRSQLQQYVGEEWVALDLKIHKFSCTHPVLNEGRPIFCNIPNLVLKGRTHFLWTTHRQSQDLQIISNM